MFVEESLWLQERIAGLPLTVTSHVLDIGSQNLAFRTLQQPWVEQHIHAPIRARGARITNLDVQDADGVDVVADLTDPGFDPKTVGRFDLVLCCNLLEHVTDRLQTVRHVRALIADGGYLAVTAPGKFPYHEDPIDTMYRPSPRQLISDVRLVDPEVSAVDYGSVACMDPTYYSSRKSRLRRLVAPMRWRASCVLLRYPGAS
jgi:SAM-dependent methyltransferase